MKTLKYKGYDLPYEIVDNKSQDTILFIHGVASGSYMVESLAKFQCNFNIIAMNLPGSLTLPNFDVDVDEQKDIVIEFINRIKTNVIVVGHSLGGAIAAEIHTHKKINKIFYVSALFPFKHSGITYRSFKSFFTHEHLYNTVHSLAKKIEPQVSAHIPKVADEFKKYVMTAPHYRRFFLEYMFSEERMKHLDKCYKSSLSKDVYFMIGDNDKIVNTDEFVDYVNVELGREVTILDVAGHNPIRNNALQVADYLNNLIPFVTRKTNDSIFEE